MTQYVRQQLERARGYLVGGQVHLAADCVRRALDGLDSVDGTIAALEGELHAELANSEHGDECQCEPCQVLRDVAATFDEDVEAVEVVDGPMGWKDGKPVRP